MRDGTCREECSIFEIARSLQSAERRLEEVSRRSPLAGPYLREVREIRALVAKLVEREATTTAS
jgi:hypothetical protein